MALRRFRMNPTWEKKEREKRRWGTYLDRKQNKQNTLLIKLNNMCTKVTYSSFYFLKILWLYWPLFTVQKQESGADMQQRVSRPGVEHVTAAGGLQPRYTGHLLKTLSHPTAPYSSFWVNLDCRGKIENLRGKQACTAGMCTVLCPCFNPFFRGVKHEKRQKEMRTKGDTECWMCH